MPAAPSAGNRGWAYRNDGVDIQGVPQDYHVFNIEDGEWLQYTVTVAAAGKYTVAFTVAAADSAGKLSLLCNDKVLASAVAVPATGGLTSWQTVEIKHVALPKGGCSLRVVADKGGFNFSQMRFSK
jgi:hypothetical protein